MSKLFSHKLTEALHASPKSQKQIAAEAGLSAAYLTQLKRGSRGNPNIETLKRLASALGVGMEHLVPENLLNSESLADAANSPPPEKAPMDYRAVMYELIPNLPHLALLKSVREATARIQRPPHDEADLEYFELLLAELKRRAGLPHE